MELYRIRSVRGTLLASTPDYRKSFFLLAMYVRLYHRPFIYECLIYDRGMERLESHLICGFKGEKKDDSKRTN